MKVDNILQNEMSVIRNETTDKKNQAADLKHLSFPSTNDKVSISSLINYLNNSLTSGSAEEVRTGKVTALKTAIDSGNYRISGQKVAEKMLSVAK